MTNSNIPAPTTPAALAAGVAAPTTGAASTPDARSETRSHVEAMIEAADAAAAARPSWLPEKFKTPEDLAKAYRALEKKLGQRSNVDRRMGGATAPSPSPLDIEALEQEYAETGALSEESYAALERVGVPRRVADDYIAGQLERGEKLKRDVLELAGGEARYHAMIAWAEATLTPEAMEAFDGALAAGDASAKLAVQGLARAYEAAEGRAPDLVQPGATTPTRDVFMSSQEVVSAMRDRRYKSDPDYRAQVQARLSRSDVFKAR